MARAFGRVGCRRAAREPGKPVFLFGHSMGGAIVTLHTLTRKPDLAGLVLSAPALGVTASGAEVFGSRVIAFLSPQSFIFQRTSITTSCTSRSASR